MRAKPKRHVVNRIHGGHRERMVRAMRFVTCLVLGLLVVLGPDGASSAVAQVTVVREAVERLLRAAAKRVGKGAVAREMSERVARDVVERALREGGEELVEQVVARTTRYGPDYVWALRNAGSYRRMMRLLDELPADQVRPAVQRLAAGPSGRELAELTMRYGPDVLRAEVMHPAAGRTLVKYLGKEGMELAPKLSTDEAIIVAQHAADIAKLPPTQKQGVLRLLYEDTKRMVQFMGRFMNENPGKTLFTVAFVSVLLANPDRVLGGSEVVTGPNGAPVVVSKPGVLERVVAQPFKPLWRTISVFLSIVLGIVAAAAAAWLSIKLWFLYRLHRARLQTIQSSGNRLQNSRDADRRGQA